MKYLKLYEHFRLITEAAYKDVEVKLSEKKRGFSEPEARSFDIILTNPTVVKNFVQFIDENKKNEDISIRFGRSAKFDGYTVQNVIVSYNGEDITGQLPKTNQEDEDLGNYKSGYLYLILPDNDNVAYVGDVSIPEKLRGQGIGKKIYQAIADKIKKPIRNSMENKSIDMNFYGQFKDGKNFWKNRDSFQPNNSH